MQIPLEVKILGHSLKVVETSDANLLGSNVDGTFNLHSMEIRLRANVAQSRKEAIFLHELMEATLSLSGQSLTSHEGFTSFVEMFYAVLKDNDFLK